ncbi:Cytochrome c-type biogenesis protein CcmH/NrfG [Parasphingorhabdus marina DSM 22363]|uniref:Cytochrome c-type biogenesis protein CcmH/NrfG n=1 Tax=Parasphingorhabdus marina DSM 22363 TaxID=1123272 RepID=A0A1N6GCY2_9SPHN|nr:tetratricopeptide repeat protein [Parasphingorhabdus marina]SIO05390.1 Cytochrome c-type biogenesis protein CcmH/NrfG [Parasphingorhabdus marina DSM 22363]
MGWLILLGFLLLLFGALLWLGKLPRPAWELTGAALLLAVAGYAWQGNPGMAGVSIEPTEKPNSFDDSNIDARNELGERFGDAREWLIFSDALNRGGKHGAAANYLRNGVKEHPDDPDLWVGLGNALVVHADGIITPAAQFAFQRAAEISPEHPGPPFFLGMAYAQSGNIDQARAIWTELLERSSDDAPWRADLESRLAAMERAQPSLPPSSEPPATE